MANKKSALKELRKTYKRSEHNLRIKTHVKWLYKNCLEQLKAGKNEEAKESAVKFQQAADKAAKRHVISVNRARRKKASLTKELNKAEQVKATA